MTLELKTVNQKFLSARLAKEGGNILSPICRMSFPHLFTKVANNKNKPDDKKYSLAILIPPECDITLLKKAASEAAGAKWGVDKVKDLKLKSPFLNAAEYKREGYLPGWTLIRCASNQKPQVLEPKNGSFIKITEDDAEVVYQGRWCSVSLNAFTYDTAGNKGVSFGLNNVVLLNHDEALGGRMQAESEFESIEGSYSGSAEAPKSIDDIF